MTWVFAALLLSCPLSSALAEDVAAPVPTSAKALAAPGVVEIETRDEDGDLRRTKIWIVSQGETIYVRTMDSSWNANLVREGEATLFAGDAQSSVQAAPVEDPAVAASANQLFAEKYGFSNTLRNIYAALGPANMWALSLASP